MTFGYWFRTSLLAPPQYLLPGVFAHNPAPFFVNGSLWTLPFEVVAYVGVLVLGLLGVLRRRHLVLALLAFLAVVHVVVVDTESVHNFTGYGLGVLELARLGLYFVTGVACFVCFDVIRRRRAAVGAGAAAVLLIGSLLGVQLLVAMSVSVIIVVVATLSSEVVRWLRRGGDPSYGVYIYSFVIQQVIIDQGWVRTPVALFMLSTPLSLLAGYASWHLVERPVLLRAKARGSKSRALV